MKIFFMRSVPRTYSSSYRARSQRMALSFADYDDVIEDLPGAAGMGFGVKVCQEAIGNAVSLGWLQPARFRLAFGPLLHLVVYYALSAIQLVFSKKSDERFGLSARHSLGRMLDAIVINCALNAGTLKRARHHSVALTM